eukprot:CAMPEP_0172184922 /NCGR_PEP_ID=MMETSP1050-20130122/19864_1 /TAXON_ID=233186 /ORGANISM="Cryptomonas curvata, Strain CCAP979/52" /LENGTH=139 /DNA_ID=CAMNT_0012858813 /DNA_START=422 /DNA_END=841 /DNA_ORIENTATION=+
MLRNGGLCGDSGYAMEEMLLGGRLRHRHIQGRDLFQVETLTLTVNEPDKEKQYESWLSDDYVEKLIRLLQTGSMDVHSRSATTTELFRPSRKQFKGANTCVPLRGEGGTDGPAHTAAGSDTEMASGDEDTEPPPPGLKS